MSWLNKLTSGIFTNSQEQILPHPPSVIAAGAPWYEEIAPPKEEIINRIHKDILKQYQELKSVNLHIQTSKEEVPQHLYLKKYKR